MDKGNKDDWLMTMIRLHLGIYLRDNYIMYPGTYVLEVVGFPTQVKVLYYSF
jgi:hypothetical protein